MIITTNNQKGGVGKTTTAANLAVLLTRQHRRVLLVDSDPQYALTRQLGVEERSRRLRRGRRRDRLSHPRR